MSRRTKRKPMTLEQLETALFYKHEEFLELKKNRFEKEKDYDQLVKNFEKIYEFFRQLAYEKNAEKYAQIYQRITNLLAHNRDIFQRNNIIFTNS